MKTIIAVIMLPESSKESDILDISNTKDEIEEYEEGIKHDKAVE